MSAPPPSAVDISMSLAAGDKDSPFVQPQTPTPKRSSLRSTEGLMISERPTTPETSTPGPASERKPKKSGVLKSSPYPRSRIQTLQFPSAKQTQHIPTHPLDKMDVFASSPPSSWRWEPPLVLERADPFYDCGEREEGESVSSVRPGKEPRELCAEGGSERPHLQRFPPYNPSPDPSPEAQEGSSPDTSIETPSASGSSKEQNSTTRKGKESAGSTPVAPPRRKKKGKSKMPPLPGFSHIAPPAPLSASVGAERLSMLFQPLPTSTIPPSTDHGRLSDSESEAPSPSRPTTPTPTRPKTPPVYTPPRSSSLPAHYHPQGMGSRLKPLTAITSEKSLAPSNLSKKSGQVTRLRSKYHLGGSPNVPSTERSPTPTPPTRDFAATLPGRTTAFPPLRSASPTGTLRSAGERTEEGGIKITTVSAQSYQPVNFDGGRATTPTRKRFSFFSDEGWFGSPRAAAVTGATGNSVRSGHSIDHGTAGRSTLGHGTITSFQSTEKKDSGGQETKDGEVREPTWVTRLFRRPSTPRPRSPSITSLISTRAPPSPLTTTEHTPAQPDSPSTFKASLSKARSLRLSSLRSKTTAPSQADSQPPSAPSTPRRPTLSTEKPSPSKSERWLKKSRSKASLRSLLHLRTSSDSSSEASEKEGWCTECGERCTRHSPHTQDPFANLSAPTSFPTAPLLPSNAGAVFTRQGAGLLENASWGAQRRRTRSNVSNAGGERRSGGSGGSGSEGWHLVGVGVGGLGGGVGGGQFGSVRQRTRSTASNHSYPPYPSHSHSLSYPPDAHARRRSLSLTAPRRVVYVPIDPGPPATLCFRDYRPATIPESTELAEVVENDEGASGRDGSVETSTGHGYAFPPPPPMPVGGFPPLPPLPPLPTWVHQSGSSSGTSGGTYFTSRSTNAETGHRSENSHDSQLSAQSARSVYSQASAMDHRILASAWVLPSQPVPEPEPEVSHWSDDD